MTSRARLLTAAALLAVGSLAAGSLAAAPLAEAQAPLVAGDPAAPPGFVAASTSWTSTSDGWVLGFSPCAQDAKQQCGTLLHTTDGGSSWKEAAVPGVRVSPRFIPVRIVFAAATSNGTPATGLASDGSRLFETTDGAKTWQRAALGADVSIGDLGFTLTTAYAIVGTGTTDDGTTALFASARGLDDWSAVPKVRTAGNGVNIDGGYDIATRANHGAVALGRIFVDTGYWETTDGSTWVKRSEPCSSDELPGFNFVGPHRVIATCSYDPGMSKEFKDVTVSKDGAPFEKTADGPVDLYTTATGGASAKRLSIGATGAGVSWLYSTFDKGRTWATALKVDDELPFHDLQFTDADHGFVVTGGGAYGRGDVYTTTDGGHTWNVLAVG